MLKRRHNERGSSNKFRVRYDESASLHLIRPRRHPFSEGVVFYERSLSSTSADDAYNCPRVQEEELISKLIRTSVELRSSFDIMSTSKQQKPRPASSTFGSLISGFRRSFMRTVSSRSKSTPPTSNEKTTSSSSYGMKGASSLANLCNRNSHIFMGRRSHKQPAHSSSPSLKPTKYRDQLSSYYIKDLNKDDPADGDQQQANDKPNGPDEAGAMATSDASLTQNLLSDCKKEIDHIEQVAATMGNQSKEADKKEIGGGDVEEVSQDGLDELGHAPSLSPSRQILRTNFMSSIRNKCISFSDSIAAGGHPGLVKQSASLNHGGGNVLMHQSSVSSISDYPSTSMPVSEAAPGCKPVKVGAKNSISCQEVFGAGTGLYIELRVRLREGKNLAIRDIGGSSDPYAKFFLNGAAVHKSKTIFKNLNPQWNEEFYVKLSPSSLYASDSEFAQRINMSSSLDSMGQLGSSSVVSQEPATATQSSANTGNFFTQDQLAFLLSKFKLKMYVYDYDRGFLNDDLIGHANIELSHLKENIESSLEVELEDEKLVKYEYLGLVSLDLLLTFKYEDNLGAASNSNKSPSQTLTQRNKRAPYQLWQCVLNVVLVEGNDLLSMDDNGFSDPYIKFKLENERYRSKTVRRSLNPRFLEQFQLYIYDMNKAVLMLSVYDHDSGGTADDFMGKAQIDLKTLTHEKTHFVKLPLEDGAGTISLLLTITATYGSESPSDLEHNPDALIIAHSNQEEMSKNYGLAKSLNNVDDVGWLQVKVLRAEGLASADINGKSDPFVSLQLINQYVQTHTEYKTLNPEWGKIYEFNVTDLHAVLEVTVLDEDKNKVYEFLGKLEIPLINIQNGKRKLYVLKDRKLLSRAKGVIELELNLVYNPLKAVIKTFNPRDVKLIQPEPKLKIPVLKQNIMRVHNIIQGLINTGQFIDSCFRWVNPVRSIIALISFIIIVLSFDIYMLPLTLLMIFLKNYIVLRVKAAINNNSGGDDDDLTFDYFEEGEEESMDPEAKEPKKSFRERLNEIQEICLKVQETLDFIASLGERVINTFFFVTPWLSWLAISVLVIASIILYMIPLRYLILLWGVNKFTKKFRKPPDYVDNTEILDFLSRVPSKKEIYMFRELKIDTATSRQSMAGGGPGISSANIGANSTMANGGFGSSGTLDIQSSSAGTSPNVVKRIKKKT